MSNQCHGRGSLSSSRAKIKNPVMLIQRSTDLNKFIDCTSIENEVTLLRLGIFLRGHEFHGDT